MALTIVPHDARFVHAVEAFNRRMHEGGYQYGFYIDPEPDWIPRRDGAKSWREYHLAVEEDGTVRGGYALKPQQWLVNGKLECVTDWQGPFTEAAVDPRYSPLMLKCMRTMQKQYPLLFSLGHGGTEEPIIELLRKMGWQLWGVPFCFKVLRPYRFLRLNHYLRGSTLRRLALDGLAYSGLGWAGIHGLQLFNRLQGGKSAAPATAIVVDEFGDWADALWEAHGGEYRCLAVRDRAMMNTLMPATGWPGGTRLRIDADGEVIGWAIVNIKQKRGDARFGDLEVALLTDCFAAPREAPRVIAAALDYIRSRNVDMAFANLSHPAWVNAVRSAGFTVLPDRRVFAISPALAEKLEPGEEIKAGLHLTNMDGHGPHGFEEVTEP